MVDQTVSDADIFALKPKNKAFKHWLGTDGLYLQVMPNGEKLWRVKSPLGGRNRPFIIGTFPEVPVTTALDAAHLGFGDAATAQIAES